jgi:polysaccharide pyruvyl transferase WcaK-like protein
MPAALIVGAFGQDNPGDEALLDATTRAVRGFDGWSAVVASARPTQTSARLDVDTVPANPAATARAAARADALVVGGGTVFKELHSSTGRRPGALLRNALALAGAVRARRRPVALVGVGAAPIASPGTRALGRALAKSCDLLVLRDEESAALLADDGAPAPLRVGSDLAWLGIHDPGAPPSARPRDGAARRVSVAVSHLSGSDMTDRWLADGLAAAADDGVAIELEPWQGSARLGADALLAAATARALPDAIVLEPPADLSVAVDRSRARQAVVALRFHAAVAAAAAGTPFVAVAHEPKLAAIARRFDQPAVRPDDAPRALTSALAAALDGQPPAASTVAHERERARASVDLLGYVLTGEGDPSRLAALDLVPAPQPT